MKFLENKFLLIIVYLCFFLFIMNFKLVKKDNDTKARAGLIHTGHGDIETPIFMPVGTAGSVKAIHQRDILEDINAQIILGNTYHLYLRPGTDIIRDAGGIHRFIGWTKPILTDSGGYQVYSLTSNRKINEQGVEFQSHIDGSKHLFTPENVIDTQRIIGADIVMVLDECTPFPCEYDYAKKSLAITHKWLDRCFKQFKNTDNIYNYPQAIFPIVQGSVYKDLRVQSAEYIGNFQAEGNAIGGLSVGEPIEKMYEITDLVCNILPEEKPRYLMGVGTPANILESIALGIDMMDCVIPTRNARNGMLFTQNGIINIRNEKWKNDFSPVDEGGTSFVDMAYSKAYLRHLFISKEILAAMIATAHNLAFYLWLVKEARKKIIDGSFYLWKKKMALQLVQRL